MHHFRTFSQTQGTSFTASTKMWSVEQQLKRSFEMLKRLVLLPVPRGRSHNARRNKARWCVSALLLFFFPGSLNFFAWNWLCSYFPRTTHQSSQERERERSAVRGEGQNPWCEVKDTLYYERSSANSTGCFRHCSFKAHSKDCSQFVFHCFPPFVAVKMAERALANLCALFSRIERGPMLRTL